LFVAMSILKKKPKKILVSLVILLFFSQQLSAKTFHILLSAEDGAPSAEVMVSKTSTSPAPFLYSLSVPFNKTIELTELTALLTKQLSS